MKGNLHSLIAITLCLSPMGRSQEGAVPRIPGRAAVPPSPAGLRADRTRIVIDGPLARAASPVTVDAEVGAKDFRITDMGADGDTNFGAVSSAVAYNSLNNEYLVVWNGDDDLVPLADGEFEIFGQRIDAATGAEVGANDFRISDMGPDGSPAFFAGNPAVAYNSLNNEYLVVWTGDDNTAPLVDQEREIFGQRIDAATGAEVGANDFRISDMGPDGSTTFFGARSPEVAYNSLNNEYLVVWYGADDAAPLVDFEFEIFGQRIDAATGAEVGANDFRISDTGPDGHLAFNAESPGVAYNSLDNEYFVVWTGDDDTPPLVVGEEEIFGQRIDAATGVEVGANDFRISDMGPDGNVSFRGFFPAVAYGSSGNEYLVVWSGDDNPVPVVNDGRDVFGQRIDAATGAELGPNDFRISDMGPDGSTAYSADSPAVAYDSLSKEYLVVWYGDDSIPPLVGGEVEIFGQRIDAVTGAEVGDNDFRISDVGPDGSIAFSASSPAMAYDSLDSEHLVVWYGDDDTPPLVDNEFEIFGQRLSSASGGDMVAYSFTGGFPSVAAPVTGGHRFTVVHPLLVTSLGVIDFLAPGLTDSHEVGLWKEDGTLLASLTIPAGTAATLIDGFRYAEITPVLLTAGQTYRLGAFFPTFADGHISNVTFAAAPGIALEQSSYTSGVVGSLTFPVLPGNAAGNATANFTFRSVVALAIDIRPGSDRNPINLQSKGVVPVAILGSAAFDVADIDPTSLTFGPGNAVPIDPGLGRVKDVNGDGFPDVVSHFYVPSTGISRGEQTACVTARDKDGTVLNGCDSISTVPR